MFPSEKLSTMRRNIKFYLSYNRQVKRRVHWLGSMSKSFQSPDSIYFHVWIGSIMENFLFCFDAMQFCLINSFHLSCMKIQCICNFIS